MSNENPFNESSEGKKIPKKEDDGFIIDKEGNQSLDNEWLKREVERTKDFTDADHTKEFLCDMLETHNPYSETFLIKPDGKFDRFRADGVPSYLESLGIGSTPAELYQIAAEIEEKYPEYHFSFETDPEGMWMKYTVLKNESGQ